MRQRPNKVLPFLILCSRCRPSQKGLCMEDSELAALPASSALRHLRPSTIDLACRLDHILAHLEDEGGFAELHISVKRGIAKMLRVERSFKLDEGIE